MLKIFSVLDVVSEAYGAPIVCPTRGIALRSFTDACNQEGSPMKQYPTDFKLYELGTFDNTSGTIEGHKVPVFVASAHSVLVEKIGGTSVEGETVK